MMAMMQWFNLAQPGWRQLLLFKAGWLALVLQPLYSAVPIMLLLGVMIWQLRTVQWQTLLTLGLTGLLLDSVLVQVGAMQVNSVWLPYWLVLLWAWFSLFWVTVFSRWLQNSLLVALFGLCGGPLAYWGGAQLSSNLQVADGAQFWLVQAPAWAALLLWSKQTEIWWKHLQQEKQHAH